MLSGFRALGFRANPKVEPGNTLYSLSIALTDDVIKFVLSSRLTYYAFRVLPLEICNAGNCVCLLLARQANDHMRCSLKSLKKVGLGDYIGQYHRLIGVIQGDARSLDYSSHAIGQTHRVEGCWICGTLILL